MGIATLDVTTLYIAIRKTKVIFVSPWESGYARTVECRAFKNLWLDVAKMWLEAIPEMHRWCFLSRFDQVSTFSVTLSDFMGKVKDMEVKNVWRLLPAVNKAGSDWDLVRQEDSERDLPLHRLGHQSRLMVSLSSITFTSCLLLL